MAKSAADRYDAKICRRLEKWDTFAQFADSIAHLSTCKRYQVGCALFPATCEAVAAVGFNGPPRGVDNDRCDSASDPCWCSHAEANAVAWLDPGRWRPRSLVASITRYPCHRCASSLINCGAVGLVLAPAEQIMPPAQWKAAEDLVAAGICILHRSDVDSAILAGEVPMKIQRIMAQLWSAAGGDW